MRSKPVAALLVDLGVEKSHSKPYVSDDNPYSEAQFKTLKYRPEFPARFGCIEEARAYCQQFFSWYNGTHCHSGIAFMTPQTVHYGQTQALQTQREKMLAIAFSANPNRFKRQCPQPPRVPEAVWINKPIHPLKSTEQLETSTLI